MAKAPAELWYQVYFRGDYEGKDVKTFFKEFKRSYSWIMKPKQLFEFRIIHYESEHEGLQFQVLPPTYLLN